MLLLVRPDFIYSVSRTHTFLLAKDSTTQELLEVQERQATYLKDLATGLGEVFQS